ncbi:MAG TPA: hypothetical protein VL286_01850 [Rhizomicrobium sp.]|jgi:hypothetical protein|nr:hypothetical protein [Rhizomicrobium sp.]
MTGTSKGRKAALGVRCHSGWAATILACGSQEQIDIIARRRIVLCDANIDGSKQPFHAAESMTFARAQTFIERCRRSTDALADAAVAALLISSRNLTISSCSILSASGRKLPLKEILASHALIHAAEGEFYRDAVACACERANLAVIRVRERDALRQASDYTGLSEANVNERLAGLGKCLGPPWTEDQKLATLAAWTALGCRRDVGGTAAGA